MLRVLGATLRLLPLPHSLPGGGLLRAYWLRDLPTACSLSFGAYVFGNRCNPGTRKYGSRCALVLPRPL